MVELVGPLDWSVLLTDNVLLGRLEIDTPLFNQKSEYFSRPKRFTTILEFLIEGLDEFNHRALSVFAFDFLSFYFKWLNPMFILLKGIDIQS